MIELSIAEFWLVFGLGVEVGFLLVAIFMLTGTGRRSRR